MAMGVVEAIYKFKYFIFCRQKKNTGKIVRALGKHREFGINWSVVTLFSDTMGCRPILNNSEQQCAEKCCVIFYF